MLLGHMKIDPYPPLPGGLYPFLTSEAGPSRDTHDAIAFVSFSNRRRASGGAFYDYSARYGAVQEEDRVTLRQSMFPETMPLHDLPPEVREFVKNLPHAAQSSPERTKLFHDLAKRLGLESFLDLPLIALSNGQTRRARILKAVLSKPDLLLLDEPLSAWRSLTNKCNILTKPQLDWMLTPDRSCLMSCTHCTRNAAQPLFWGSECRILFLNG